MAERSVARRFLARQREVERGIRAYWAVLRLKVRVRPAKSGASPRAKKLKLGRLGSIGGIGLASYRGAIIDSCGRRGVFQSVKYYGARRTRFGVGKRMVVYITRNDGVEYDAHGNGVIMSNVGATPDEIGCAFELLEVANRSARGNSKLMLSMIVGLPHDVPVEARKEILERFCDQAFDLFDLPYCAALHTPSEEGDQRNYHAHILFSFRPMRKTGDHEWEVGRELLTEHDCKEQFFELRKRFAEIMTQVVQDHGKGKREYTHLSNTERGLKAEPQEGLDAALTAIVRRGGEVDRNERNRERVETGTKLMAGDRSTRRLMNPKAILNRIARKVEDLRMPRPLISTDSTFALTATRLARIERPARLVPIAPVLLPSPLVAAVIPQPLVTRTLPVPVGTGGAIAPHRMPSLNKRVTQSSAAMNYGGAAVQALPADVPRTLQAILPPPIRVATAMMSPGIPLPSSQKFVSRTVMASSIDLPSPALWSSSGVRSVTAVAAPVAPNLAAEVRIPDRLLELLALFAAHKKKAEAVIAEKEKVKRANLAQLRKDQEFSR